MNDREIDSSKCFKVKDNNFVPERAAGINRSNVRHRQILCQREPGLRTELEFALNGGQGPFSHPLQS
jgi:hypothetical protein